MIIVMEFLILIFVSLLYLFLGCVFASLLYFSADNNWGKKYPKLTTLLRFILTPVSAYIGFILSAALVRSLFNITIPTGLVGPSSFSIYFWQCLVEPLCVGYATIWAGAITAPRFHNAIAYIIALPVILESWMQAVKAYNYRESTDLAGLFETYQVAYQIEWYWNMIYSLMIIAGVVISIFALRRKELGFEPLRNS